MRSDLHRQCKLVIRGEATCIIRPLSRPNAVAGLRCASAITGYWLVRLPVPTWNMKSHLLPIWAIFTAGGYPVLW